MATGRVVDLCEECGQPARVRILETYSAGRPVFRVRCLNCADAFLPASSAADAARAGRRPGWRAALIVGGLVIGALGGLGDQLGVHGSRGFGAYQLAGVLVGVVCVVTGAVTHADAVAIFGTIVFGVAVSADLLSIGGVSGFGWKQQAAIIAGLVLTLVGVLSVVVARRARSNRGGGRGALPLGAEAG